MAVNLGQTGASTSYAGFWARVAAYIVDVSILTILGLAILIGAAFAGDMAMLAGNIALFFIYLLYWPVMESSARQATFGKSLVGIQVTDLNGNRLTFLRSLLRNLAKIISAIPLYIGFLLAAFTGRKQALHDMITKCLVVRTGPSHFIKALAASVGALAIAVGGAGAYFYYVIMPKAQSEMEADMQAAMQAAAPPVVTVVLPPPVVTPEPASSVPPVTVPVAQPEPEPAVAIPPIVADTVPEKMPEPVAEVQKPEPAVKQSTRKKPGKPLESTTPAEPMDSQSEAPAESKPRVKPAAAEEFPIPPAIVNFAPDTESKVIRPKYNDVMTAVLRGDRDGVKQLLDLGWWVDKPGPDGYTPLVAAVMNRDTQMVQLLLDHGAVPSSQALQIARKKKDTETASLLEQRGAR